MTLIDAPILWHVVFHPGKRLWSRRFCHVSLAGYAQETWLYLDLQRPHFNAAAIYKHDEVEDFLTFLLHHHAVVKVGFAKREAAHFFRPMTCVSFVKHVLGVRSSALRPDGLFQSLIRDHGGVWLNENPENQGNTGAEGAKAAR